MYISVSPKLEHPSIFLNLDKILNIAKLTQERFKKKTKYSKINVNKFTYTSKFQLIAVYTVRKNIR